MVNVLVYGMTDNPGGMESCIMNYYRNIDSEKVHFDFLCNCYPMVYREEVTLNGSEIFYIPKKGKNPIGYYKAIDKFFKENSKKYDYIWYNTCTLANIDYLVYAKKYGIKNRIIHAHNAGNEASKLKGFFHKINRKKVHKIANIYWSCSEIASDFFYLPHVKELKEHRYITNAIDLNKYLFQLNVRNELRTALKIENSFVVGHVGRFTPQKNHLFLLDIFNEILKRKP